MGILRIFKRRPLEDALQARGWEELAELLGVKKDALAKFYLADVISYAAGSSKFRECQERFVGGCSEYVRDLTCAYYAVNQDTYTARKVQLAMQELGGMVRLRSARPLNKLRKKLGELVGLAGDKCFS